MRLNRKKQILLVFGLIGLVAILGFVINFFSEDNSRYTLSGTIEANEIRLSTRNGGVVREVYVNEGDQVNKGQALAQVYSPAINLGERISSPINGVLLERLFEPNELASPGDVVMVVADLNNLELRVYAPEDRYGQFSLGQIYPVTVDSSPGEIFNARISRISSKAEFTPRNVQTVEGRKSTVFAITLEIVDPSDGRLIPGMPADVHFNINEQKY
jgi:multidrug efflux pump subunit AcrA (membrane-fusion protein)